MVDEKGDRITDNDMNSCTFSRKLSADEKTATITLSFPVSTAQYPADVSVVGDRAVSEAIFFHLTSACGVLIGLNRRDLAHQIAEVAVIYRRTLQDARATAGLN